MKTLLIILTIYLVTIDVLPAISSTTNIALRKKAYISEAYKEYTADKAVDGNADTYFSDHCVHGQKTSHWIVIDLGGLYWVGEVHITSTNYLASTLDYIIVGLSNNYEPSKTPANGSYIVCGQLGSAFPLEKKVILTCPNNTPAMQFVMLLQPHDRKTGYLTLSELEVYEHSSIDFNPFVGCFESFEDKVENNFQLEQQIQCDVGCRNSNKTYFSIQKNTCLCGNNPIYSGHCDGKTIKVFAVCPIGLYGSNCSKICNCKTIESCSVENGMCPGESRFESNITEANSTTKDSYAGCVYYRELLYSEVAHQLSNQDCVTACRWRHFDLAGWDKRSCWCLSIAKTLRDNCENDFVDIYAVCPIGTYGYNCSLICHCKQGKPCSYLNGKCHDGCQDGWMGSNCDERDCFVDNGLCEPNSECSTEHNKSFCFCNKGFTRATISSTCEAQDSSTSSADVGIAIGIVIAVLLMLFLFALLFYFVSKRSYGKYLKLKKYEATYYSRQIYTEHSSEASNEPQDQGKQKLINFPDYVAANSQSFADEFKSIPMHTSSPCTYGLQKHLKNKNRFKNIIPYDNNRVILKQLLDNESSDYINASFIMGCSKTIMIASQGPTPQSVHDFWRMIGEQDVGIIIMLCNLEENNKKKCTKYWPNIGAVSYGGYKIQLKTVRRWRGFTERTFVLETPKSIQSQITQLHYTSWPDHGVPDDILNFLNFRKRFKMLLDKKRCTSVVHCSAGVGRTGCFLAIEYLLEKSAQDDFLDVPECITKLRSERPSMVQTLSQYEFIYNALVVKSTMGDTLFKRDEYLDHCRSKKNDPKYTNQLMNQFEMVLQSHSFSDHERSPTKNDPARVMSTSGQLRFAISSTCDPSEVMKMLFFRCNTFVAFDPCQILLSIFTSTTIEVDEERSLKLKEIIETNYGTKVTIERIITYNDDKTNRNCYGNSRQTEKREVEVHLFEECLDDTYVQFNRMLQIYNNVIKVNVTIDQEFGVFNLSESDSAGMFVMFAYICDVIDSRSEVSIYDQLVELHEQTRTLAIRTLSSFQDLHYFAFNYLLLKEK